MLQSFQRQGALRGICLWTMMGALSPDTHYTLVLSAHHGALQPLTPFTAYAHDLNSVRVWIMGQSHVSTPVCMNHRVTQIAV